MIAARHIHQGVSLPPRARQEMLELVPEACLPRGFALRHEAGGLMLIRERDGARLGTMASMDVACRHASALARIEAQQMALQEVET